MLLSQWIFDIVGWFVVIFTILTMLLIKVDNCIINKNHFIKWHFKINDNFSMVDINVEYLWTTFLLIMLFNEECLDFFSPVILRQSFLIKECAHIKDLRLSMIIKSVFLLRWWCWCILILIFSCWLLSIDWKWKKLGMCVCVCVYVNAMCNLQLVRHI